VLFREEKMNETGWLDALLRRRELLAGSLAFGASRLLPAAPMAGAAAVAASAADASALNGAEVKALFVGDPFAQASQRIIADLNKMAGGTISMQVVDFDSMHQKMLLDAPSASPAFDVYSWEFSWLGEMVGANALRPLDDLVQRDAALLNIDDIPKANWEATVWNGKRYGIPVQPHAELTWWRTDLLQAAGLQPPKTTDDLLAAAKALNKPDDGVYGFIWKGGRGAPLGQTMIHAFAAFDQPAFPNWQKGDWMPALNTDKAIRATEWAKEMAQYAPPDYLNIAWDDEARRFAEGQAAMTFTWFGRESFFSDPTKSKIVGRYAAGPWPAAPGLPPRNSFGGWVLGLPNKISPERAEIAWRFVRWYTSAPVERLLIENGNIDFPRISLIEDPALQQAHPVFKTVLDLVNQNAFKGWIRPPVPEFVALADALGTTMQDMLLGDLTPKDACDKVQNDMVAQLKRNGKLK
jgi:multiple sugar transport system substrate-binding protein